MAMALSSTMGPSERQRRRPLDGETEEEKEDGARATVRFHREARNSDQTLAARPRRWEMGLAVPRTHSSFFPDSTDEEVSAVGFQTKTASSTPPPRGRIPGVTVPAFPVVHIGDVQFPITRSVLWDRRVLAGPFHLSIEEVLPRVCIGNSVLKQLHQRARDAATNTLSSGRLLGYATTDDSAEQPGGRCGSSVTLSQLVHRMPERSRSSSWFVAFHLATSDSKESQTADRRVSVAAARARYESTSCTRGGKALPLDARGMVSITAERSHAELAVEVEAIVPRVHLQFELIRSLPLLTTPLAASLLRCDFGSQTLRFGFLTLDRARKAVPLLETDPLVLQRPIVGIWVYGVDIDDPNGDNAVNVSHPYLFESCVRYLSSTLIKERAQVDTQTFLVAVYPGDLSAPLPRFFECQAPPRVSSPTSINGWGYATAHGRCLAGVSSFRADLQLTLAVVTGDHSKSSATDTFVASRDSSRDSQAEKSTLQLHTQLKSEAQITERTNVKKRWQVSNVTSGSKILGDISRNSGPTIKSDETTSNNEIQELRDELARVLHILSEAQAENARLIEASKFRSSASPAIGGDADREQKSEEGPVNSCPRYDNSKDALALGSSEKGNLENEIRIENVVSDASSLALSSISLGSDVSGLSSVSSSLVGTRLKNIFTTEGANTDTTSEQDDQCLGLRGGDDEKYEGATHGLHMVAPTEEPTRVDCEDVDNREGGRVERQWCPERTPLKNKFQSRAQCERDEFEDQSDSGKIVELLAERLHVPHTPDREEIVRKGALSTLGFSHGSSFSIPRIKYVSENVTSDSDEDEQEELRRIELKYENLRVH